MTLEQPSSSPASSELTTQEGSMAVAASPPIGVLLMNIGTPNSPETKPVRKYLKEFLSDARVLDLPAPLRWMLLNLIILPTRPKKSAEAYRKVWGPRGSPLLYNSQDFAGGLADELGPGFRVELGMNYGNPNVSAAYRRLIEAGVEHIVVFPLYPQLAASSTGASLDAVYRLASQEWCPPALHVVEPFYNDEGFINSAVAEARPVVEQASPDHVLFSFHGLPERHIKKSDPSGKFCLASKDCCASIRPENRGCYRAQAYQTARRIADKLDLPAERWSVAFQSRLGRTPWIKPYTDDRLPELVKDGCKNVVVICAAFVADCLETLEEIGIRAQEDWVSDGGDKLTLVPAVNASPLWLTAASELVRRAAPKVD